MCLFIFVAIGWIWCVILVAFYYVFCRLNISQFGNSGNGMAKANGICDESFGSFGGLIKKVFKGKNLAHYNRVLVYKIIAFSG